MEEDMQVANRVDIKKKLLELGFLSFKDYCRSRGLNYITARDVISGRLTGERSEYIRKMKQQLIKDFGEEIFEF